MAFGLVVTCVLLELALNLGALFVHSRPISAIEGRETILTLGDSHTYGVFTKPEESYPGQLQVLLDERAPGRYNVVNLGLPGNNSSEIVAGLPEWIARFRPFAVIVCVGINNVWNRSDSEEVRHQGAVVRWLAGLRLMRLYHIMSLNLRSGFSTPQSSERPELQRTLFDGEDARVEHRDAKTGELLIRHEGAPSKQIDQQAARQQLHRDLEDMRLITEQWNVQLVLLTYSSFKIPGRSPDFKNQTIMSEELREFSKLYDLPLVDTHDHFRELLAGDVPREKYFLNIEDDHPNPSGYAEIASMVVEVFEPR